MSTLLYSLLSKPLFILSTILFLLSSLYIHISTIYSLFLVSTPLFLLSTPIFLLSTLFFLSTSYSYSTSQKCVDASFYIKCSLRPFGRHTSPRLCTAHLRSCLDLQLKSFLTPARSDGCFDPLHGS